MSLESYKRSLEHDKERKERLNIPSVPKDNNYGQNDLQSPLPQYHQYNNYYNYYPQPKKRSNGIGTAGLVMAILSVVLCFISFSSPLLTLLSLPFLPILILIYLLSIIFSIIGLFHSPREKAVAGFFICLVVPLIFLDTYIIDHSDHFGNSSTESQAIGSYNIIDKNGKIWTLSLNEDETVVLSERNNSFYGTWENGLFDSKGIVSLNFHSNKNKPNMAFPDKSYFDGWDYIMDINNGYIYNDRAGQKAKNPTRRLLVKKSE